ncbi:aldo/keto reductase [uncultured Oscillibacter sp.]|uniref:aldo/keto reductase n=1 Tax=uncultured Oscillibacter sp. TaxID=876091 RepID=UPI0026206960|nr:aldo/keto reductase [uncultured Oscillibacter sp.]
MKIEEMLQTDGRMVLFAGPCVIESESGARHIAREIKKVTDHLDIDFYFKASWDKANRTKAENYRGPGLEKGLEILQSIKESLGVKIITDIHEPWQAAPVAEVADILQIPAFLCRQTDLLRAAAETGKAVNVKKAQFHNAAHIFDADAVKALETARQEGLAERIGVSIYTPEEAMRALAYPQISVIQIPYNVFDRRLDRCGFFAEAKKKNVRIYARSTLLQGLLTMTPERLPVHMKFAAPYVEKFHSICIRGSISPLRAAVGFVKSHQDIHYLVFGSDNERQLHEYLSIAAETLSPKVVNELNNEFDVVEERLVKVDSPFFCCLSCFPLSSVARFAIKRSMKIMSRYQMARRCCKWPIVYASGLCKPMETGTIRTVHL